MDITFIFKGQKYTSDATKKKIAVRELGPPCACRLKCMSRIKDAASTIFHCFWNIGNFDVHNNYISSCISISPPKCSYPKRRKKELSSRKNTATYSVKMQGEVIQVCKAAYLSVHGLQKSRVRMENIVQQVARGKKDQRGHHKNYRKYSPEVIAGVYDHILRIPTYQSTYSRHKNVVRKFKEIEHRFLITGHTRFPSDRDFAMIEKYKGESKSNINI